MGRHRFEIEPPPALVRYIAAKGSVALDGISLTVAEVNGGCLYDCGHSGIHLTIRRLATGAPVILSTSKSM